MFYDIFLSLCADIKISPSKAATEIGIDRSNVTNWKNNGYTPREAALRKIAEFFGVPVDFLLQAPPFDVWEHINANRKGFFYYIPLSSEKLMAIWGIDKDNPDAASIRQIVGFISSYIADIRADDDGNWIITPKDGFDTEKKNPATGDASDRFSPDNAALAYALWDGDTEGIDDQDIEDVRRFAAFIREKKKKQ